MRPMGGEAGSDQSVTLLPHSNQIKIEGVRLSESHMAVFERSGGLQVGGPWQGRAGHHR